MSSSIIQPSPSEQSSRLHTNNDTRPSSSLPISTYQTNNDNDTTDDQTSSEERAQQGERTGEDEADVERLLEEALNSSRQDLMDDQESLEEIERETMERIRNQSISDERKRLEKVREQERLDSILIQHIINQSRLNSQSDLTDEEQRELDAAIAISLNDHHQHQHHHQNYNNNIQPSSSAISTDHNRLRFPTQSTSSSNQHQQPNHPSYQSPPLTRFISSPVSIDHSQPITPVQPQSHRFHSLPSINDSHHQLPPTNQPPPSAFSNHYQPIGFIRPLPPPPPPSNNLSPSPHQSIPFVRPPPLLPLPNHDRLNSLSNNRPLNSHHHHHHHHHHQQQQRPISDSLPARSSSHRIPPSRRSTLRSNSSLDHSSATISAPTASSSFPNLNDVDSLESPEVSSQVSHSIDGRTSYGNGGEQSEASLPSLYSSSGESSFSPVINDVELRGGSSENSVKSSAFSTDTFDANPRPPPNLTEGIRYGSLTGKNNDPLEFMGQFPDVIILSRYPNSREGAMIDNPLYGIESWSWNRLLTFFMWHGNSRIEAGPLDVAEADDLGLGPWQISLSVLFTGRSNQSKVRLIAEMESSTKERLSESKADDSQISSSSAKAEKSGPGSSSSHQQPKSRLRRISTVSRLSLQLDKKGNEENDGTKDQLIEIPRTKLNLPLSLSCLASSLHEIHRVSQMTNCSLISPHGFHSLTQTFHSHGHNSSSGYQRKINKNAEALTKLRKAIDLNSKLNGEDYVDSKIKDHIDRQRLMIKGKQWLNKKKVGVILGRKVIGKGGGSGVGQGGSGSGWAEVTGKEPDTVDGSGLPLPNGATLIQPWDYDWV